MQMRDRETAQSYEQERTTPGFGVHSVKSHLTDCSRHSSPTPSKTSLRAELRPDPFPARRRPASRERAASSSRERTYGVFPFKRSRYDSPTDRSPSTDRFQCTQSLINSNYQCSNASMRWNGDTRNSPVLPRASSRDREPAISSRRKFSPERTEARNSSRSPSRERDRSHRRDRQSDCNSNSCSHTSHSYPSIAPADSARASNSRLSASPAIANKSNAQTSHTSHKASHSNCSENTNSNTHRSDEPESTHQHSSDPTSNSIASAPTSATGQSNSKPEKVPLRECGEWGEYMSSSGRIYYYNARNEKSQWLRPDTWTLGPPPSQSKSSAPKVSSTSSSATNNGVPSAVDSSRAELSPQSRHSGTVDERSRRPQNNTGEVNERLRVPETDSRFTASRQSLSASGDRERDKERERDRERDREKEKERGTSDKSGEGRTSNAFKGSSSHTSTPNKSLDGGRQEAQSSQKHSSRKLESAELDGSLQKRSRLSLDANSDDDWSCKREERDRGAPGREQPVRTSASSNKARRSTSPERSSRPLKQSSDRERSRDRDRDRERERERERERDRERSTRFGENEAASAAQSSKDDRRPSGDMDISPASPARASSPNVVSAARALYVHGSSRSQSSMRPRHSDAPQFIQSFSSRPVDGMLSSLHYVFVPGPIVCHCYSLFTITSSDILRFTIVRVFYPY